MHTDIQADMQTGRHTDKEGHTHRLNVPMPGLAKSGQARPRQARLRQVRSGQASPSHAPPCQPSLGQPCHASPAQPRPCQLMLSQVMSSHSHLSHASEACWIYIYICIYIYIYIYIYMFAFSHNCVPLCAPSRDLRYLFTCLIMPKKYTIHDAAGQRCPTVCMLPCGHVLAYLYHICCLHCDLESL